MTRVSLASRARTRVTAWAASRHGRCARARESIHTLARHPRLTAGRGHANRPRVHALLVLFARQHRDPALRLGRALDLRVAFAQRQARVPHRGVPRVLAWPVCCCGSTAAHTHTRSVSAKFARMERVQEQSQRGKRRQHPAAVREGVGRRHEFATDRHGACACCPAKASWPAESRATPPAPDSPTVHNQQSDRVVNPHAGLSQRANMKSAAGQQHTAQPGSAGANSTSFAMRSNPSVASTTCV